MLQDSLGFHVIKALFSGVSIPPKPHMKNIFFHWGNWNPEETISKGDRQHDFKVRGARMKAEILASQATNSQHTSPTRECFSPHCLLKCLLPKKAK